MADADKRVVDGIRFPVDYAPFPALLANGEPVTVISATTRYALVTLSDGREIVRLVEHLRR